MLSQQHAGAGAGPDQAPPAVGAAGTLDPGHEEWRDWAGLPEVLLAKVAEKFVAQNEAGWAARKKEINWSEEKIQAEMAKRKREGICPLFVFARVCKPWRKAQLKVGGPLRTRVKSDVILPGRVALVKWALAEGCPRHLGSWHWMNLATDAAEYGHTELVKWLCGEEGIGMDKSEDKIFLLSRAAATGNLELVQWLHAYGCPWNDTTCFYAYNREVRGQGGLELLRWARANGAPWEACIRDLAAKHLGYTDDFGNLIETEDDIYSDDNYNAYGGIAPIEYSDDE